MSDRILVVARGTLLEAIRDRVLLIVVLFAAAMVLGSRVLGWLSIEDELKMVQDFSLTGLSLQSLFLAMLVGAGSLAREMERRTVYTVLTRQCSRAEFILGKFVGLVMVFWLCLFGAALLLAVWIIAWHDFGAIRPAFFAAIVGLAMETVVLTAVALFLGALAAPALASVGVFAFYLVGHGTEAMRELTSGGRSPEFGQIYEAMYLVLPNLENLNFINMTTMDRPVDWGSLGMAAGSAGAWTVILLVGATILFERRQF